MRTIRQLRQQRGWTQYQLAVKLDVTPSTVYVWERGKHIPRADQLRRIAQLFGVSMDEIAFGDELSSHEPRAGKRGS